MRILCHHPLLPAFILLLLLLLLKNAEAYITHACIPHGSTWEWYTFTAMESTQIYSLQFLTVIWSCVSSK